MISFFPLAALIFSANLDEDVSKSLEPLAPNFFILNIQERTEVWEYFISRTDRLPSLFYLRYPKLEFALKHSWLLGVIPTAKAITTDSPDFCLTVTCTSLGWLILQTVRTATRFNSVGEDPEPWDFTKGDLPYLLSSRISTSFKKLSDLKDINIELSRIASDIRLILSSIVNLKTQHLEALLKELHSLKKNSEMPLDRNTVKQLRILVKIEALYNQLYHLQNFFINTLPGALQTKIDKHISLSKKNLAELSDLRTAIYLPFFALKLDCLEPQLMREAYVALLNYRTHQLFRQGRSLLNKCALRLSRFLTSDGS